MKITSHDGTQYRQTRLEKVRKVASIMLGMAPTQLDKLVVEIHDNKGTLKITWLDDFPSDMQRVAFSSSWEMVGENKDAVRHGVSV